VKLDKSMQYIKLRSSARIIQLQTGQLRKNNIQEQSKIVTATFLPHGAIYSANYAAARCLSVCLSVRPLSVSSSVFTLSEQRN